MDDKVVEHERTKANHLEREEGYRLLFENNPQPMWVYDRETLAFLAVNDAAVRKYGYCREEFLGMTIRDIRPAEDVPALPDTEASSAPGMTKSGVWRHRKKDGAIIDAEISGHTLTFGGRPAKLVLAHDVTERSRTEQAIRNASHEWYRIFDAISTPICLLDGEGKILRCNKAKAQYLNRTYADIVGRPCWEVVHGTKGPLPDCPLKTVLKSRKRESHTLRTGEKWFEVTIDPFFDDSGTLAGAVHIMEDITERRNSEERIFQSKQDWEYTFNSITDMVTVHDTDYNIILANRAAERILGFPLMEQMKDRKCFAYYHGTNGPPCGCPSCECLQSGVPAVFETFEPHLNAFIEIRAIPRFDGNNRPIGMIHIVRDITERKKTQEALERYSSDLTSLNIASNTLMTVTSSADIYQKVCNTLFSVFDLKMVWLGIIEEGIPDVKAAAHSGVADGDRDTIRFAWGDLTAGPVGISVRTKSPFKIKIDDVGFAPWREEAVKLGYASILVTPLITARDTCIGALAFYGRDRDYFSPDRMKLCQIFANQATVAIENARLVGGLEESVSERTRELEDANMELQALNRELELRRAEAETASRSKTDFLANMSHELRTPLNAIMGFTDIMQGGMAGPVTDKQKEFLGDITTSAGHLLALINDILDLSKVEAGKLELELGEVSLRELVESSLVMFKEKALKHAIAVTVEIDDRIGVLTADKRKVKQVLMNLLSNAFKFTPGGGSVRVSARLTNDEGRKTRDEKGQASFVPASEAGGRPSSIEISVSDTGIGITRDNMERLFQPFQQVDTSLTRKYSGSGLGLSLCRRFVELHGGRIWAESEVGKGSTFTFVLPGQT